MQRMVLAIGLLVCLAGAAPPVAHAGDGRLEINAACVATGCFPGDTAGFPITTAANQSYVLTSSLVVPDANTTAVVLASGAALDLNGFTIEGVTTCSGTPTVCSGTGSGDGVENSAGDGQVRNGTIRKMGATGIIGRSTLVENLRVEQNGAAGLSGGYGADGWVIRNCRIQQNGGDGIAMAFGGGGEGAVIAGNVIRDNGGDGIEGFNTLITGNGIDGNAGFGLRLNFGNGGAGYANNVINSNNGGSANPQTLGGVQIGTNVCGGDATCP